MQCARRSVHAHRIDHNRQPAPPYARRALGTRGTTASASVVPSIATALRLPATRGLAGAAGLDPALPRVAAGRFSLRTPAAVTDAVPATGAPGPPAAAAVGAAAA